MQYRLLTLLLFIAVCAAACALVARVDTTVAMRIALTVPQFWIGLGLLVLGRAIQDRPSRMTQLLALIYNIVGGALVAAGGVEVAIHLASFVSGRVL